MEPLKKIYYKPKAIIKSPVIFLPISMVFALLICALLEINIVILCCFGLVAVMLILGLNRAVKSALTFYPDGIAFFDKYFISFDEIENISLPSSKQIILFALKRKSPHTWWINCWQIYMPQRCDMIWLIQNKQPNDIVLNNITGLGTPLEELLACFPADIPIIENED